MMKTKKILLNKKFSGPEKSFDFSRKEDRIGIVAIVLAAVGLGYIHNLLNFPIDVNFTIIFMLLLTILYVLLKDIRLK